MAGRFAAKEAMFKALNAPMPNRITWHDIEVINDERGAPIVQLHGAAAAWAAAQRLRSTCLTIAHVRDFAVATAVCEWPDKHA
jgi:holo-[acyl-carrier protein] synthase